MFAIYVGTKAIGLWHCININVLGGISGGLSTEMSSLSTVAVSWYSSWGALGVRGLDSIQISLKWKMRSGSSHDELHLQMVSGPWGIILEPVQSLKQTNIQTNLSDVYDFAGRSSAPGALFYTSAPIASRCATTTL